MKGKDAGKCGDDAAHRDHDVNADLEQSFPEGGYLCPGTGGSCGTEPDLLHQHVRRRGEQDTKLISPEAGATGAVDLEAVVKLFDAVLDFAPLAVDLLVDPLRACPMLVTTNRGLFFGSRPGCLTTSALTMTRRFRRRHVLAA